MDPSLTQRLNLRLFGFKDVFSLDDFEPVVVLCRIIVTGTNASTNLKHRAEFLIERMRDGHNKYTDSKMELFGLLSSGSFLIPTFPADDPPCASEHRTGELTQLSPWH